MAEIGARKEARFRAEPDAIDEILTRQIDEYDPELPPESSITDTTPHEGPGGRPKRFVRTPDGIVDGFQ